MSLALYILGGVVAIVIVLIDARSADRALYFRMQRGEKA